MYVIISTAAKVREKDRSLHFARCSFTGKAEVDGKTISLKENDSFKQIR
jgi:hypothetical protein